MGHRDKNSLILLMLEHQFNSLADAAAPQGTRQLASVSAAHKAEHVSFKVKWAKTSSISPFMQPTPSFKRNFDKSCGAPSVKTSNTCFDGYDVSI